MRNTTDATIDQALAFVRITGDTWGLLTSTRLALYGLAELNPEWLSNPLANAPMYALTPEAIERSERSALWKAHAQLTDLGFVLDAMRAGRRRPKIGHLSYRHQDDARRRAFTGRHGSVYVDPDPATKVAGSGSGMIVLAKHRNGGARERG